MLQRSTNSHESSDTRARRPQRSTRALATPNATAPSRVVVVSPSFAGNTDTTAAAALAPWCGPETTVDIYAPFTGTRAIAETGEVGLELSKGLLSGLRRTGATVTVHAIPARDDDALDGRRLHAKVLAITKADGSTVVLSGSANCTGPGLEGRNRELMVRSRASRRPEMLRVARGQDVDLVLVCWGRRSYSAAQRVRRQLLAEKPSLRPDWEMGAKTAELVEHARRLGREARRQNVVLFLGAGVSAGAGLPAW